MSSDSRSSGESSSSFAEADANANANDFHQNHSSGGGGGVKFEAVAAPKRKRTARSEHDHDECAHLKRKKSQTELQQLLLAKGVSIFRHINPAACSHRTARKPEKGEYNKKAPGWSPDDEMRLAKVLIACSSGGHVQMAPFYERAHRALPDTTNSQLYDKMRRMRNRFWQIKSSMALSNILSEDRFPFRSHHECLLFKLWKHIWGEYPDNHSGMQPEKDNNNEDNKVSVPVQLKKSVEAVMVEGFSRMESILLPQIHPSPAFDLDFAIGSLSAKFKDIIESLGNANGDSLVNCAETKSLRQKWRRLKIDELRLLGSQIELLQDECRMCLKRLDNTGNPQFKY
eukprot:TRINITY_DN35485_c0_g1_i1.p1 TRINITY_DN35485_c0_g1~~TRINITY_DN35485_c0_g1_i1.p1  ORF type:complete len:342 (+),score=22.00 TRINITY_DN35485_c0_g1_i1:380-1405(+)